MAGPGVPYLEKVEGLHLSTRRSQGMREISVATIGRAEAARLLKHYGGKWNAHLHARRFRR